MSDVRSSQPSRQAGRPVLEKHLAGQRLRATLARHRRNRRAAGESAARTEGSAR